MSEGDCIPIVEVLPDNGIIFRKENFFSVLEKVGDRPFAVIAVAGPKRTGKSYLCKNILYYLRALEFGAVSGEEDLDWFENAKGQKDFRWRNGSERCTAGINIRPEPVILHIGGEEIAILIMDTEGSFDDQTNMDQSARIFAWTSLLSSNFVYNIKNDIREDTLQFLESFLNYADLANLQEEGNNSMQKLMFAVRDCEFSDYRSGYYDKNCIPPRQLANFYDKLEPSNGITLESRQIRENLHSKVKDVSVCLFPHPGRALAKDDCEDFLDSEFTAVMVQFVESIARNLKVKHMYGHPITGLNFKRFVDEWDELFRGNQLPEMLTVAEAAQRLHNNLSKEEALKIYMDGMTRSLDGHPTGMDDDILVEEHNHHRAAAFTFYDFKSSAGGQSLHEQLSDDIDIGFGTIMCHNGNLSIAEERRQMQLKSDELEKGLQRLHLKDQDVQRRSQEVDQRVNQMLTVAAIGVGVVGAGALMVAGAAPASVAAVATSVAAQPAVQKIASQAIPAAVRYFANYNSNKDEAPNNENDNVSD